MLRPSLKYICIIGCISVLSIVGFIIVKRKLYPAHFLESYSQEGEDMVIRRLVGKKREGFYVDVGAYHPMKLSNTYHFYKRGWRGINIDARPGSMTLFQKLRPKDTNIEVAIGNQEGVINYYLFEEPAFNTCNPAHSAGHIQVKEVSIRPLKDIFKKMFLRARK